MPKMKASSTKGGRGLSLHLGLNAVDSKHYQGWSGELFACEFDAKDMQALAKSCKLQSTILLTRKATRKAVLAAVGAAAKKLTAGDLFLLTYSGHGGQVDDVSGDEDDKLDETWCLYDGELIDDELYLELSRFATGVRVLVLSDSCHSGTVTRARPNDGQAKSVGRSKMMPPIIARRTYEAHKKFYDNLQLAVAKAAGKLRTVDPDAALASIHATASHRLTGIAKKTNVAVILLSGCQDRQTSMDGNRNGAFTEQLLKVWDHGAYRGSYTTFLEKIKAGMPKSQTPNLFAFGPVEEFKKQQPFTV